MTERDIILESLIEIFENGAFMGKLLDDVLTKYAYLEPRKKGFIAREVTGVTERYIELDGRINAVSKTKTTKMKPLILTLLRMGVYEICYMDKVPASATCNEMVKIARKRGFSGLSGFVNGVLRTVSRDPEHTAKALSDFERANMPEWIYRMWQKRYGTGANDICEAFLCDAPLCVRANSTKITASELAELFLKHGYEAEAACGMPAVKIKNSGAPRELPGFSEGLFYVQDESSMAAIQKTGVKPGDRVLDCCAAPGGKTTFLAELTGEGGTVTAWDVSDEKTKLIAENAKRLGLGNISIEVRDASEADASLRESFDLVYADVPCSGLGVFGKKPDIRLHATPQEIDSLLPIQKKILEAVAGYVKAGGRLCYSTCTINEAENEDTVTDFLSKHSEYRLISSDCILPDKDRGNDGFFIAVMEKLNGA